MPVVRAAGSFGKRSRLDVKVDIVGDEEVEMAVAVIVKKQQPVFQRVSRLQKAGFGCDICERPVSIVAVENVLTVVADEEIVPAVVVIVAHATALSPAAATDAGLLCDVGEGSIAIVFEEMGERFLALREAFDAGAVDEEDVRASRRGHSRRRQRRSQSFREGNDSCARHRRWFWRLDPTVGLRR